MVIEVNLQGLVIVAKQLSVFNFPRIFMDFCDEV